MISVSARKAIESAMVSMITESIGRPDKGWISRMWMTAPTVAAMASGKGSSSRLIVVTAKYAPQTTNMPWAKLKTSVALKTTAKPRTTRPWIASQGQAT